MTRAVEPTLIADEYEIGRVRRLWATGRDNGEWALAQSCFHPGATVTVSWYSGSVDGFFERAKQMLAARKPGHTSRHSLGNQRIQVNGRRGTCETDALIQARDFLDGHWFDYVSWSRFYDFLEKRDGAWRIARWQTVYDKDRLDPVIPGSVPASFFDGLDLAGARGGFAFMELRQKRLERAVPPGVIMGGSAEETNLHAEGRAWLAGA
jgi:hypothetical protein